MYDYFEIFLERMMLCRKSAEVLGTTFKLTVNGRKVLQIQLTKKDVCDTFIKSQTSYGGLAQLGERLPCKQEVTSSNLVFSTRFERTACTLKTAYKNKSILK